MSSGKFNLDKVFARLKAEQVNLPQQLANTAKTFFTNSFNEQGWTDNGKKDWDKRKSSVDAGRAILIKTGKLRRAVSNSKKSVSWERIEFRVEGVDYAAIHNFGGVVTRKSKSGKVYSFTMPKREFMGNSAELNKMLEKKITLAIEKIWQG